MRFGPVFAFAACLMSGGATAQPTPSVAAKSPAAAEQEVSAAAAAFISAFNALDAARFDPLWADDASVFFPQPPFPIRRVDGKADVLKWFGRFMDSQRKAGKSPAVDPKELSVQLLGADSALVSFHLGADPNAVARRTLVYRRDAAGWRIVHLHGSALRATNP